jgi:glycosyltransferase involved in cell wall biosynthesis
MYHHETYSEDNIIVIGQGLLESNLRLKYKNENSIHFLGSIDYDLIYRFYAISDVFILPTLEDNWSLVVPEAMSCGLPIATTFYNGCYPELVIKDFNGIIFDSLEQNDILLSLSYFHLNISKLKVFGENSKKLETEYTPFKVASRIHQKLVELYQ